MTLKELKAGESARILSVGGEGALRQHFLDMGVIPGAEMTVIKFAPMGDPMELPNYRMPGMKNVVQLLWEKAKDFLQRAFTVILLATMCIWFLQSFDLHFNLVTESKNSILAMISSVLVPIFVPLGLGDWRICTSLINGFMAKESVVSSLQILFGGAVAASISPVAAASLLVFSLLYTPCVAAIASIRRELGRRWALGVVLFQCGVAWIMALLTRGIVSLFL